MFFRPEHLDVGLLTRPEDGHVFGFGFGLGLGFLGPFGGICTKISTRYNVENKQFYRILGGFIQGLI